MSYTYSDMKIGLPVGGSGNVDILHDDECIRQSIMTIFSTVSLERVRNPIGSRLIELLFQPMNSGTANRIKQEMANVISKWEPRVRVTRLIITPNMGTHTYDVDITYTISKLGKDYNLRTGLRSFA